MEAKCSLCGRIDELDDESPLAKKLRNRPIHTYMCDECHKRVTERTKERFSNAKYKVYHRMSKNEDEW